MDATRIAALCASWPAHYAGAPAWLALAPGRVNLIGEHTDYNEGHVLPMTIDRHVAVAAVPRPGSVVRLTSLTLGTREDLPLDVSPARSGAPDGPGDALARGVIASLLRAGLPLTGADLLIDGDLPMGAGLASSAALELGLARALLAVVGAAWEPGAMARLCRQAEEDALGVRCGPMDQIAVACGAEGAALLLDCRNLQREPVRLPERAAIVVMDSGVRRRLAQSDYNARRRSCEAAVAALAARDGGVRALRDADAVALAACREQMDATTFRRALHVIEELPRPAQMARALAAGDLPTAGALMNASHRSLADLYEVSGPELDLLTALARSHRGCHGARLTGAGFGGCAVALVERSEAAHFVQDVQARYRTRSGLPGKVFVVRAAAGTSVAAIEPRGPREER